LTTKNKPHISLVLKVMFISTQTLWHSFAVNTGKDAPMRFISYGGIMSIKATSNGFRLFSVFITLTLLFSNLWITSVSAATVRFAKPGFPFGRPACTSWADACTLEKALNDAVSGDQIWVKAGTYTPGSARTDTFQLKSGVEVYGGFGGNELLLLQRSPSTHVTILSGEIGNVGVADNVYHVVTGATGAYLDGVTISGGNANGDIPNDRGGGMYNNSSSPTLYLEMSSSAVTLQRRMAAGCTIFQVVRR
jgi:hypothetical protein